MTSTRHRVLVADDEEGIRFLWRNALLKPAGAYEVVTACDGCEALEEIARAPFDLVVTDISMPAMGGIELTEAIRQLGYRVPVIWITAYGVSHLEEKSKQLGIFCCLDKPLRLDEMRQAVADALAVPREEATA